MRFLFIQRSVFPKHCIPEKNTANLPYSSGSRADCSCFFGGKLHSLFFRPSCLSSIIIKTGCAARSFSPVLPRSQELPYLLPGRYEIILLLTALFRSVRT